MRILGIDPGLAHTGWGVIETVNHRYRPVSYGVIRTKSDEQREKRIISIASAVADIALEYKVEVAAMEDIFFAKNVTSALSVSKVIGAMIMQLSNHSLEVTLFTPLEIKMAVTGIGTAQKEQVQEMVKLLLSLTERPKPDHASDALAVAITYGAKQSTGNRKLH